MLLVMENLLKTILDKFKHSRQIYCLKCPAIHGSFSVNKRVLSTKDYKDSLKGKSTKISAFENIDCLSSLESHQCSKIISKETELILQEFKFLKSKRKKPDALYTLHPDLADIIIAKLGKESCKSVIFEINPGPGILTKKLLEAGFEKIKLFETKNDFLPSLLKLQENYPKQLQVNHMDLLSLPKKLSKNNDFKFENQKKIFDDVMVKPWVENIPPLIIVGTLHPSNEGNFLRYLISQLATLQSIYSYGRAQLVVFISGKEIEHIFSNPSNNFCTYRYGTVMYNLFYDIKVLHKETRSSFYPPQALNKHKEAFPIDNEHLYLVKMIPKKNLLNLGLPVNQLEKLLYFIRHLLHRRSWSLIDQLRKWVPETEIYKMGYTDETKTGDLHPEEFMRLFKLVMSQADNQDNFQLAINHNLKDDDDEETHGLNNLIPTM